MAVEDLRRQIHELLNEGDVERAREILAERSDNDAAEVAALLGDVEVQAGNLQKAIRQCLG